MGVQFTKAKVKLNFKKEKPTVYKIQQVNYSVVDTKELIEDVAESCGLNKAMTKAVIEGIVQRACRFISMGHAVQIGELGTVKPVFTTKTKETAEELGADNVITKKVRFYSGKRLKDVVKGISVSEYDLADGTIIDEDAELPNDKPTDPDNGSNDNGEGGSTEME